MFDPEDLKENRRARGLSPIELAEQTGTGQTKLVRIERGDVAPAEIQLSALKDAITRLLD